MSEARAYSSIAVVCEAPADRTTACSLADRVFVDALDWLTPELLDHVRRWRGFSEDEPFLAWKHVSNCLPLCKVKPRFFGHFDGGVGKPDAWATRLALSILVASGARPDGVLLLRDSDNDLERRAGMEQARSASPWPFPIAVGLAHCKREAWILAGFTPADDRERAEHTALVQELSFDPLQHPELLTAREHGARKDIKPVLARLTASDPDREQTCLKVLPLHDHGVREHAIGLADFCLEVRAQLVPLLQPE